MERLSEIVLLEFRGLTVNALQLTLIGLTLLGLLAVGYVLIRRLLPWYYGKESISERNRSRTFRVVRFVLISIFSITLLRVLDIDFIFFRGVVQPAPPNMDSDIFLNFRITTLIRAVVAFTIANVLDWLIEEFLVQRYHKQDGEGSGDAQTRFRAVRPLMYTLAIGFIARDTGLADLYFTYHFGSNDPNNVPIITLGNLISAVFILFAIRLILLIVTTFILHGYYQRSKVDRGSQYAINRLLTYFVYFIGVLLVIQAAGFDLVVIWTGAAALLVGIGIGLQQTFNDLICGIIILFERSVMVGDVVEISSHQVGTVRKIGARTSIVETRDDIIIFVPNSKLIGENVINWSHVTRQARFHVGVGVAYGSDLEKVRNILAKAADEHDRVMDTPKPIVRFLGFGDSSLDFDLLFWSRDFMRIEDIKSDLRFAIDAAFRKQGVEIPFPQRDLWVRGGQGLENLGANAGAVESDSAKDKGKEPTTKNEAQP